MNEFLNFLTIKQKTSLCTLKSLIVKYAIGIF